MIVPRPPVASGSGIKVLAHFRDGLRYVRQRPSLYVSVLMVILIALFGVAIVQLIEPISRHVFHVGAGEYGLMSAAYGLGAVIGGVFTVAYGDTFRRSRLAFVGLALMAAGDLVLGVAPEYQLALVALLAMGLAQVLCMVSCSTAIQVNVDEAYRGRASSMFTMSFFAAAPIGALVGGIVGDLLNLRITVVAAAMLLAACTVDRDDPVRSPAHARRDAAGLRRGTQHAPSVRAAPHRPRYGRSPGRGRGRLVPFCTD